MAHDKFDLPRGPANWVPLSPLSFIARAASSSGTTMDSSTQSSTSGHIDGSTDWPPAPSTQERFQPS